MLKIRLTRFGSKHCPCYRIVIVESNKKRDGKYAALVGTYQPLREKWSFNEELVLKYLSFGAQPTIIVKNLLQKEGIWKKFIESKQIKNL